MADNPCMRVLPLAESKYTSLGSECILGQSNVPAYDVQTPVGVMLAICYGWYEQRSDVLLGLHMMNAMHFIALTPDHCSSQMHQPSVYYAGVC